MLITNRLAARAEKRKEVQEWYEETYITNGVDRLIIFFKSLLLYHLSLKENIGEIPRLITEIEDVPVEALTRVEALLQGEYFVKIIILVYPALGSGIYEQRHAAAKAISEALSTLYGLRKAFLKAIPKMSRKHHEIAWVYRKQGESLSEYMEQVYVTLRDRLVEVSEDNPHTAEEETISETDKPELNTQTS